MIREAQTTSKQQQTQSPEDRKISARVAFPNFVLSIFKISARNSPILTPWL